MSVRVAGASQAAALDAAAIQSGVPSRALMRVAAVNAASVIASTFARELERGVVVFTGAGNNGGDGWALAGALARSGVRVRVAETVESRSVDARAERALAIALAGDDGPSPGLVVDALLGTGVHGDPDEVIASAIAAIAQQRADGARVVSLDVPSGMDSSTGAARASVVADMTISFGTAKRGTLANRAPCGEIVVVDIGLGESSEHTPKLVDSAFVLAHTPAIEPLANKGTRRHVAIVAGGDGMGGAAIIAATAALRSGAGLVKVFTAPGNAAAVHERIPEALVARLSDARESLTWADSILVGPGLGNVAVTRDLVESLVRDARCPLVLDADALNAFAGATESLAEVAAGRSAVLTPHPAEMARLIGSTVPEVLADRWHVGESLARTTGCHVLLKGTPTVISSPDGTRLVSATGTAALATGGSGDALGGTIATLLAQGCAPAAAAACAAWVHGRAAELLDGVRGTTLDDVLAALRGAWNPATYPRTRYPVLAALPAVR